MAVEARHINLFPSQFLNNRANLVTGGIHSNVHQMDSSDLPLPAAASAMANQSLFPFYNNQSTLCDPINSARTCMNNNDDSGLTCNFSSSRKRSRDELITELNDPRNTKLPSATANSWSFIDRDLHLQIQNQQSEIDLLIAQHTEKVRIEFEEQRRRQLTVLHSAIQEIMMKKLNEKDEEIQKIGKLNWALQERVKTLTQENQIWKELAETNEATANSLRCNLEQILAAHVSEDHHHHHHSHNTAAVVEADDAESSCGSNGEGQLAVEDTAASGGGRSCERLCSKCGVRESKVLLLPCRHLSLCTLCGSSSHNCPVCHSGINGSVHVNFS